MTQGGDEELAARLHAVAIHLLRRARVEDMASGMSATRLSVLSVLVYGGERTVTELAVAEQVATPTMTRLLQGMEAAGHVRRVRDGADRRILRVSATAQGRRVLERARQARVRQLSAVLARVPRGELSVIEAALGVLDRALGE